MAKPPSTTDNGGKTVPRYKQMKDARENQGAMQYPQYTMHRTRDQSVWIVDSSKDNEHITIQHRSGSMIQFQPDGGVQFISHNGEHKTVFGELRTMVTGAEDHHVKGDSSIKTYGDRNETTEGGRYVSTGWAHVDVAQSMNGMYEKQWDVSADSASHGTKSDYSLAVGGATQIKSQGPLNLGSHASGTQLHGETGVGIHSSFNATIESNGITSVLAKGYAAMDGNPVFINCKMSLPVAAAITMVNGVKTVMGVVSATPALGSIIGPGAPGTQSGGGG